MVIGSYGKSFMVRLIPGQNLLNFPNLPKKKTENLVSICFLISFQANTRFICMQFICKDIGLNALSYVALSVRCPFPMLPSAGPPLRAMWPIRTSIFLFQTECFGCMFHLLNLFLFQNNTKHWTTSHRRTRGAPWQSAPSIGHEKFQLSRGFKWFKRPYGKFHSSLDWSLMVLLTFRWIPRSGVRRQRKNDHFQKPLFSWYFYSNGTPKAQEKHFHTQLTLLAL